MILGSAWGGGAEKANLPVFEVKNNFNRLSTVEGKVTGFRSRFYVFQLYCPGVGVTGWDDNVMCRRHTWIADCRG